MIASGRGRAFVSFAMGCVLLFASCRADTEGKAPILIGYIGALSGISAAVGRSEVQGIELAIDEANERGGLRGGRKLGLIKYDDGADSTKSIILALKLAVRDDVLLAFATNNSHTALADLPVFTKARMSQVTSVLNADITSRRSAYIFRDCSAGPIYETTLVDYLFQKGFRRFALISDMTAYGKGEADYQQAALRRDGVDSLIRESYVAGDADYSRQLEEILALSPDAILLGGLAVDSGLIALQARRLGYKGQIAGGVSIGTPEFIKVAGAAAAEAIFASAYIDGESAMERDFSRRYKAKWGEEPESHGVEAYDGMMMVIEAIKRSVGALTRDEIARQLHATRGYQGLQGAFTFQNNGEGISRARVGIIERGRLTAVEDSAARPRS